MTEKHESPDGYDAYDPVSDRCPADADGVVFEPPDAVDRVIGVANLMATFAAERLMFIAAMREDAVAAARLRGGRMSSEITERSLRLELAAALRITEYVAGSLLALADAAVHRYPAVWESLHRADVTERHAEILVAAVDAVEPEFRQTALDRGLALAEAEPVGSFRRAMGRLVETLRSATLPERHERAARERRVFVELANDGMAWLHLYHPAVEVHAIHSRATDIAKVLAAQEGETRTLDQCRADVVADLLLDGSTTVHPAEARGIRASVVVTVPVLALLAEDALPPDCDPPTVEGIGPIPHARARELCGGSGEWMRVLTHPETGMVLSVGRDTYRPPPSLRKLVKWRSERCMAPGCGMPAARCQIDHNVAWEHGGSTSLENHAPFCQGHHTVKHHGGWTVRQLPGSGGVIEWTSPTGRRYAVPPERRVPVFHPTTTVPAPL